MTAPAPTMMMMRLSDGRRGSSGPCLGRQPGGTELCGEVIGGGIEWG